MLVLHFSPLVELIVELLVVWWMGRELRMGTKKKTNVTEIVHTIVWSISLPLPLRICLYVCCDAVNGVLHRQQGRWRLWHLNYAHVAKAGSRCRWRPLIPDGCRDTWTHLFSYQSARRLMATKKQQVWQQKINRWHLILIIILKIRKWRLQKKDTHAHVHYLSVTHSRFYLNSGKTICPLFVCLSVKTRAQ